MPVKGKRQTRRKKESFIHLLSDLSSAATAALRAQAAEDRFAEAWRCEAVNLRWGVHCQRSWPSHLRALEGALT
jgi:hypothetical protein